MSEKKNKNKQNKKKLLTLYFFSFIASIFPLAAVLIINWDKYTETPEQSVKLCIGGLMAAVFIFLKVIGKLHMPRRIVLFGVVFIMSYLLQVILNDLVLLSGMALFGEVVDYLFFQRSIKTIKEQIFISKSADATAVQVEEVIKRYVGNGRV